MRNILNKSRKYTMNHQDDTLIYNGKERHTPATKEVEPQIKSSYKTEIKDTTYRSSRILTFAIQLKEGIFTILSNKQNMYATDISKPKEDAERFYEGLQDKTHQTK